MASIFIFTKFHSDQLLMNISVRMGEEALKEGKRRAKLFLSVVKEI